MRFVDISGIVAPANWTQLAEAAGHDPLWSYFRIPLESIIGKKCWYSESDNAGAVNPIDHFRPKGAKVKALTKSNADLDEVVWESIDATQRSGYPYLIYELSNYRYSCDYVNSLNKSSNGKAKGKSNFFPLQIGSVHATNFHTIVDETIALLDPCVFLDSQLLFFTKTGYVEPHFSVTHGTWNFCRVKVSIEVYHLHYFRWIEKRKEVWNSCKDSIEMADLLIKEPVSDAVNINIAHHILLIKKKIDKKSEFSATAIDCIKEFKSSGNYSWLDSYFPDGDLEK